MNFFEHQDQARSSTRRLVLLFALAVASLILVTTFIVVVTLNLAESQVEAGFNQAFLTSDIFFIVSAVVIAVVMLGTLFRMAQLRGGGAAVAESLGGRLLNLNTRDADERKILNVVEEMAIASGISVPAVYLLEDPSINAFAAGYRQEDAVIGVTRGCIRQLGRDELQGVIAHEFSHVFNGDMRLNIRLMGWLYGITVIGLIGYFILRGSMYSRHSRRGKNKGSIVFLGLGLVVVGYGGTFFGNLIKAAVSRQREFLADASAVQYTRNPDGIAGALKQIMLNSHGSLLESRNASEVSHMLFSQGIKTALSGLFATHPPLEQRIQRIDPHWDGKVEQRESSAAQAMSPGAEVAGAGMASGFAAGAAATETLVGKIGEPDGETLRQGAAQLAAIPALLRDEAHSTLGACLLVHCLIISRSHEDAGTAQLDLLRQHLSEATMKDLYRLLPGVQALPRKLCLPLVELLVPSLKQLSAPQSATFLKHLYALMQADKQFSLFEWCIFRIVQQHLGARGDRGDSKSLSSAKAQVAVLLSALAHAGHKDAGQAGRAFAQSLDELGLDGGITLLPAASCGLTSFSKAVDVLRALKPLQKPRLLKAMAVCIASDGKVQPEEAELFRAVGAILDCPLPPLAP